MAQMTGFFSKLIPVFILLLCSCRNDVPQVVVPQASATGGTHEHMAIVPASKDDYGSGITYCSSIYWAGGPPGELPLFLGQVNHNRRDDRAVVRFDISRFAIYADNQDLFNRVTLTFTPCRWRGKAAESRMIEVQHIDYDCLKLSHNDIVDNRIEIIKTVSVKNDDMNKPLSLDVTKFVNKDVNRGFNYSAFRFRDVEAETDTGNRNPRGLAIQNKKEKLPVLDVILK